MSTPSAGWPDKLPGPVIAKLIRSTTGPTCCQLPSVCDTKRPSWVARLTLPLPRSRLTILKHSPGSTACLLADRSVDRFAKEVSMAGMTGGFLHEGQQHPPEGRKRKRLNSRHAQSSY